MPDKSRDEQVVLEIIRTGAQREKTAALKYLQSVSAKAEADIVNVSGVAQNRIISAIEHVRASALVNYGTQQIKDRISAILGKMASDIEVLLRRMIIANVLSGKIKTVLDSGVTNEAVLMSIVISTNDSTRIEGMLSDSMAKVRHGAELSMASVMSMVQKAAIRSNMPRPKTEEEATAEKIKQEPMSIEFSGEEIDDKRPSVVYREKGLTAEEANRIRANPIAFVNEISNANMNAIRVMRSEYQRETAKSMQLVKSCENPSDKTSFANKEIANIGIEMRKQGVAAFTDRGGKRWSLMTYCSMTARTTSTESTNVGEVFGDSEHDLYYIVPHGGSCPLCAKYEGKVYSRSGKDTRYPPLASVFKKIDPNGIDDLSNTYMSIHPNCRHKIIKYVAEKLSKKSK